MNAAKQNIRIGVVGLGEVAQMRLLPALLATDDAELRSIVSRDQEKARDIAKQFGATMTHASYTEMLKDPEIDAVIIATPDKLHAPMAIAAARAGKHIFVEKPIATEITDANLMIMNAKIHNVILAVGYHLRHHAGHRALKAAIVSGAIGTPKHLRLKWGYNAPKDDWRANETLARWWALAAVGTHGIDLAAWLLGQERLPQVSAERHKDKDTLEHSAEVRLHWEESVSATIIVSNRTPLPRTIEIYGTNGFARCDDTLGAYGKGSIMLNGSALPFIPVDPYRAELADFVSSIREGRSPRVSGEVGLLNLTIMDLIG